MLGDSTASPGLLTPPARRLPAEQRVARLETRAGWAVQRGADHGAGLEAESVGRGRSRRRGAACAGRGRERPSEPPTHPPAPGSLGENPPLHAPSSSKKNYMKYKIKLKGWGTQAPHRCPQKPPRI